MRLTKKILLDFGRFLYRSGEISYERTKDISLSWEIDDYIRDTWQEFIKNKLSKSQEKAKINFKQTQENL